MPPVLSFSQALAAGSVSTEQALAIFDALDVVDIPFMLGAWRGTGFPTGHPLDGALEAWGWHGKRFDSAERVHPLVFRTGEGGKARIRPVMLPTIARLLQLLPGLKSAGAARLGRLALPLLATRKPHARLRMTEFRGRVTATMIYDDAPVNDVFRKVDAQTVLGLMDMKGMARPFFFVLRRE